MNSTQSVKYFGGVKSSPVLEVKDNLFALSMYTLKQMSETILLGGSLAPQPAQFLTKMQVKNAFLFCIRNLR